MTLYALDGIAPEIDPDVGWIAPTAVLVGRVVVGAEAGIWFGVVARGDNEAIIIGARTNVQENTVLHTDMGFPLTIGEGCTIGHKAMLHGCTIGDNTLIGMGATVLNGAKIGQNCLIGAGALITEGKAIPDGSLVVGAPGKVIRDLDEAAIAGLRKSADAYARNARRFASGLVEVTARPNEFEPA
ncbi:gamma carbonic anhydrase family protein [Devosia neptuniae]|jgi:carbonic anhydrase/acetyltransferase-like protein (isoleucine patch superfamily)|uniref:gamma carbonic anhydrase family protein n=1 Tax=Devosia TaxID=46913 RepID=UPI0022B035AC|nr:gamma carbonic anhydrase family protein [Devosia neptuniae]MCZ4347960.1 gamma carbonic anhydrase family protein [Devosia neptuniae]|tara:strand:+ start:950 stop:1504 length:555 start_codon:yes stop_codon:yes gene_type:complete